MSSGRIIFLALVLGQFSCGNQTEVVSFRSSEFGGLDLQKTEACGLGLSEYCLQLPDYASSCGLGRQEQCQDLQSTETEKFFLPAIDSSFEAALLSGESISMMDPRTTESESYGLASTVSVGSYEIPFIKIYGGAYNGSAVSTQPPSAIMCNGGSSANCTGFFAPNRRVTVNFPTEIVAAGQLQYLSEIYCRTPAGEEKREAIRPSISLTMTQSYFCTANYAKMAAITPKTKRLVIKGEPFEGDPISTRPISAIDCRLSGIATCSDEFEEGSAVEMNFPQWVMRNDRYLKLKNVVCTGDKTTVTKFADGLRTVKIFMYENFECEGIYPSEPIAEEVATLSLIGTEFGGTSSISTAPESEIKNCQLGSDGCSASFGIGKSVEILFPKTVTVAGDYKYYEGFFCSDGSSIANTVEATFDPYSVQAGAHAAISPTHVRAKIFLSKDTICSPRYGDVNPLLNPGTVGPKRKISIVGGPFGGEGVNTFPATTIRGCVDPRKSNCSAMVAAGSRLSIYFPQFNFVDGQAQKFIGVSCRSADGNNFTSKAAVAVIFATTDTECQASYEQKVIPQTKTLTIKGSRFTTDGAAISTSPRSRIENCTLSNAANCSDEFKLGARVNVRFPLNIKIGAVSQKLQHIRCVGKTTQVSGAEAATSLVIFMSEDIECSGVYSTPKVENRHKLSIVGAPFDGEGVYTTPESQIKNCNMRDPAKCYAYFKANQRVTLKFPSSITVNKLRLNLENYYCEDRTKKNKLTGAAGVNSVLLMMADDITCTAFYRAAPRKSQTNNLRIVGGSFDIVSTGVSTFPSSTLQNCNMKNLSKCSGDFAPGAAVEVRFPEWILSNGNYMKFRNYFCKGDKTTTVTGSVGQKTAKIYMYENYLCSANYAN